MSDYQREAEDNLMRRAQEHGGRCLFGMGEVGAAMRLTEGGMGYWHQASPFVPEFVLLTEPPEQEPGG
jgi:hypothetical protein